MGSRGLALALMVMAGQVGMVGYMPRAVAEDATAFGTKFTEAKSPGGIAFLHRFDDTTPYAAINFGWRDHSGAANAAKAGLPSLTGPLLMLSADGTADDSLVERMNDLAASEIGRAHV